MCDRHPKWTRVEPGTVIPAGQPYRAEYPVMNPIGTEAIERVSSSDVKPDCHPVHSEDCDWFVDSSWKPPLVLPTALSLILAEVDDRFTEDKVLLTGPHTDKGNTWWSFDTRLSLIPDEINSFEVLWTEGQ